MSDDTSSMPSELRARLRDEASEEQADLEAVWTLLGAREPEPTDAPDVAAAWDEVVAQHPELASPSQDGRLSVRGERESFRTRRAPRPSRSRRRPTRRWVWAAALVVLLLVLGAWWWRQPVTVTVPVAQQRTATLPDGSTVELNSGTTLSYRRGFQAWPFVETLRRTVQLDGEAFFEVAAGDRPFAVETAHAWVEVTGTRFNVRARNEGESATEVTVTEGRVQVVPRERPERDVVLNEPGQTSRVTDPGSAPSAPEVAPIDHVLAWRDAGFAVRDQTLSSVAQELERRYDVSIMLHASVQHPDTRLTLYYPESTALETILQDVCTAHDLRYRATSRGYELFAGGDASSTGPREGRPE